MLIGKQKYIISVLLILLIFFGTNLTGYANITPVKDRTPQVRDAIVAAVPGVTDAADVTEAHLAAITSLNLRGKGISMLKTDDFSGMTALTSINLYNNNLSNLPDNIFKGLTSLTTIRLGRNAVDPLPFSVSLEKVAEGQFKTVAPAGALFNIVLPITVTNGSVTGGAATVTIPHGSVESNTLTVTRTVGTTANVTVDIGTLPSLPRNHHGYVLTKSDTMPFTIISGTNTAPVFADGASTTRTIAENTATGQNIGTAVAATDAENDTLTYTLSGNPDASAFDISSTAGQLKTKASLDYETKNTYTVKIHVSDGSLTDAITVTINITDVQEVATPDPPVSNTAPAFLEGENTARIVLENTAAGVNIGNPVLATDVNKDALTYTLGGIDAAAFDMDSSGQLITKSPLDYEKRRFYTITVTVSDEILSDTISVIIAVIDVNDTFISVGFVPVANRTLEVGEAIVAAVPNVTVAADVTELQVAAITSLNLRGKGMTELKTGDFSGMTALSNLNLHRNDLRRLPPGIFDGLTALTSLRLGGNVLDPMPLIVFLQNVGVRQFRVVITTGAPFTIVLPISVTNGSISDGSTAATIPQGSMESATFTVVNTPGVTATPIVSIGTLPSLPANHFGYSLALSNVCNRTQAVAEAIAKAVGVSDCSTVTEVDLATITSLDLSDSSIASLNAVDFDGLFSLKTLYLDNNDLTVLPDGVFDDLVSLGELFLNSNKLTTFPSGVFSNLTFLTSLYLQSNDLSSLPSDAFDGLSSLRAINLQDNDLTSLPDGLFDGKPNVQSISLSNNRLLSLPNGIFTGLTQLKQLDLSGNPNPNSQMSLIVVLQKVGTNQFKSIAPSGAPFAMTLPIKVTNGTLGDGVKAIIIPKGSVESRPITVTRTAGTVTAVTADISTPLPSLPSTHNGYALVKSTTLPLEVLPPLNSSPVFKDGASTTRTVAENTAPDTNIGDPVEATDQDANDTLTYTLGGTDAASFTIDSTTGDLKTKAALDFETKKTYSVTLTVSDGLATDTITVTINVIDVDENRAPVFIDGASTTRTVAENTAPDTNIGDPVEATDQDTNDTLTYTLGGTDAASFTIDSTTGDLKTKAALDFETKKTYSVTLTVSDGLATDTITVTINVIDVDENRAPVFTDGASTTRTVAENTAAGENIGNPIDATDADGDTLTYRLSGPDATAFGIDTTTGELKTSADLDYETKAVYSVSVTVSDGKITDSIAVTINVTDVEDDATGNQAVIEGPSNNAPVFTDGSSTTRNVSEDAAIGVDIGAAVAATDADGHTLIYSLGGTDAASFGIVSTTGQLQTGAALDYETDRSYSVTVNVSDGTLTDSINVTINVTDVSENNAPTFGTGTISNISATVGTAITSVTLPTATDADGDSITYTVTPTPPAGLTFAASTSVLSGTPTAATVSATYTYTASDGTDSDTLTFTIAVSAAPTPSANNAPTFGTGTISDISATVGTAITSVTLPAATDADNDSITYTVTPTPPVGLTFAASTRVLSGTPTAATASATYTYTASDGTDSDTLTFIIAVSAAPTPPANNAPTFGTGTISDISATVGTAITSVTLPAATDADNDSITYSLSPTPPAGLTFAASTRVLSGTPTAETASATYTYTASDGTDSDTLTFIIAVSAAPTPSANNAPTFGTGTISDISATVGTAITSVTLPTATDADGDSITYTVTPTPPAGLTFAASTRVLSGTPTAATVSATYTYTASDGTDSDTLTFTIVVNAAPTPEDAITFTYKNSSVERIGTTDSFRITITGTITAKQSVLVKGTVEGYVNDDLFGTAPVSEILFANQSIDVPVSGIWEHDGSTSQTLYAELNGTTLTGWAPAVQPIPSETSLFANFPNPFNPETWIPYHLAKGADVTLTIYDMRGVVVRTIALGHQAAGVYSSRSRAIHWDGKNAFGEKVASGVYFYTLTAGDFSATRKMLIRK